MATKAGLDELSTYRFRHTSLATAIDNTENLRSVIAFGRHTNREVTAGYTNTGNVQLRKVSDTLRF